jgi:hypothetical protein
MGALFEWTSAPLRQTRLGTSPSRQLLSSL